MTEPNVTVIHPILVETFHSKTKNVDLVVAPRRSDMSENVDLLVALQEK